MALRRPNRYGLFVVGLVVISAFLILLGKNAVDQISDYSKTGRVADTTNMAVAAAPVIRASKMTTLQVAANKRNPNLPKSATIVVQLSGEIFNNIQHMAHGYGLHLLAKELYDIDTNIVLRHFEGPNNRARKPKWKSSRAAIQQCFSVVGKWDFSRGNTKDFSQRQAQQKQWLGGTSDHMFGLLNSRDLQDVTQGLTVLNDILQDPSRPPPVTIVDDDDASIRLPYLYSQTLDIFPLVDKYYEEFRRLFQFNTSSKECCGQLPLEEEVVFHFRNYDSELIPGRAYEMGFAELSPHKTAKELFSNLKGGGGGNNNSSFSHEIGDSVAITTRIPNQGARDYVQALQQDRNISARLVRDQTGVQDFCFLLHAKRELVGNARSTFLSSAALLGNSSKARLYNVDTNGIRRRHTDRFLELFAYNWTNPVLQKRLVFELYQHEEMQ
jgi:hypothetical protein